MERGQRVRIAAAALTLLAMALLWAVGSGAAQPGNRPIFVQTTDQDARGEELGNSRESLYKNIKLFNDIAFNVENRYMEDVDTKDMIHAGIRGMLSRLDPFSVLMERRSYDQLMENTSGKYQGVGMQIDVRNDTLIVVSPIEGTPAYRLGLFAGDRIVAIDGESTEGMSTENAAKLMRGPAGTSVTLTILRPGIDEPMDYLVDRAVIELKSVNYYGVTDDNIGYVRLNRFAETTHEELREALTELNGLGVSGLIFDLRSNGGGLLDEAVRTVDFFLEPDRLVVYTQGRDPESEQRFLSTRKPLIDDIPLVVLVNRGSASASEIVAGALQDWDRGLIMGQTTFGKGLVQQVFNIGGTDSDVALKLTTARYYVPSGRSIQKSSHSGPNDKAVADDTTADQRAKFYTASGRTVYGGGGIVPDIELELDPYEPIEINLDRQGLFFSFAVDYVSTHSDLTLDFEVTPVILSDFESYIEGKEFTYSTPMELQINSLRESVSDQGKDEIFSDALATLDASASGDKEDDFTESTEYISRSLKRHILRNKFGERGVYEQVILKEDPSILKALEVLKSDDEYKRLLSGPDTHPAEDKSKG